MLEMGKYEDAENLYLNSISIIRGKQNHQNIQQHAQPQFPSDQLNSLLLPLLASLANLYSCERLFDQALPLYIERRQILMPRQNKPPYGQNDTSYFVVAESEASLCALHDLALCYSYQERYLCSKCLLGAQACMALTKLTVSFV